MKSPIQFSLHLVPDFSSVFLTLLLFSGCEGVNCRAQHQNHLPHQKHHLLHRHGHGEQGSTDTGHGDGPDMLFVFGDSYADTGNNAKTLANSWRFPYGITFPGKPSGRFSDGRILTDYIAGFVGVDSPIPYRWRKFGGERLKSGMNFAHGGTGVFPTLVPGPNMSTQIGFLDRLLRTAAFSRSDLRSSVALVTLSGNDYDAALAKSSSAPALLSYIPRVVGQLALNLKRIHGLGVARVAVTALQPLGCLPRSTAATSFRFCNESENAAVGLHNRLLRRAVEELNAAGGATPSAFVLLDLYGAFMSVLNQTIRNHGEKPLEACCVGVREEFKCGSVERGGRKMYRVCGEPRWAFFWDSVHPTQEAWRAVAAALLPHLQLLGS